MEAFQISYFGPFFNVVKNMFFLPYFLEYFVQVLKKWVLGLNMTSLKTKCILFMKM